MLLELRRKLIRAEFRSGQAAGRPAPKTPPTAQGRRQPEITKVEDTYFSDIRFFLVLWYTEKTRLTERSDFTLAAYPACSSPDGSGSFIREQPTEDPWAAHPQPAHHEPVLDGSISGGVSVRNL
jgi:hypothetical protein